LDIIYSGDAVYLLLNNTNYRHTTQLDYRHRILRGGGRLLMILLLLSAASKSYLLHYNNRGILYTDRFCGMAY